MMIIQIDSPTDDKLHQPHKDKTIFNAHWGDTINPPCESKDEKVHQNYQALVEELNYCKQEWLIPCQQII